MCKGPKVGKHFITFVKIKGLLGSGEGEIEVI